MYAVPFMIPWKLIGLVLAVIAVITTIYLAVNHYQGLLDKVSTLEGDKIKLELANTGFKDQIARMQQEKIDIQLERDKAEESTQEAKSHVAEFEANLKNKDRLEREKNLEASKKASLLLKFLQNYEECIAENFDDFTGKCNFKGQFVKEK